MRYDVRYNVYMKKIVVAIVLLFNVSTHAGEPLIVAHRGASLDAPENTIPAFKLAWEQGADAIEGDYFLTKDGHIVCIHDDNTKRVSDVNLIIRNSTLAELRTLDVGIHSGAAFKGAAIPIIDEVFRRFLVRVSFTLRSSVGQRSFRHCLRKSKKPDLKMSRLS